MKNIFKVMLVLFCAGSLYAQVGVNTSLPVKTFHIDGKKDNPPSGLPNAEQMKNDVVVDQDGKVGIGTIDPQAKLDVRGDVKIESSLILSNSEQLNPSQVSPLFIDNNGKIGKATVEKETSLAYLQPTTAINLDPAFTTQYNSGQFVLIPFKTSNIVINLGGIIGIKNDLIEIKENGFYQISLFLGLYYNGIGNPSGAQGSYESEIFLKGQIAYQRQGSSTWNTIAGIRPIFKISNSGGLFYPQVFPTTIVELKKGDLIRVGYTQSYSDKGVPQGAQVATVFLGYNTNLGIKAFQFSISKL